MAESARQRSLYPRLAPASRAGTDGLLEKALQLRQGREAELVLQQLAQTLTNKLIHAPVRGCVKRLSGQTDVIATLAQVYRLPHPERNDGAVSTLREPLDSAQIRASARAA